MGGSPGASCLSTFRGQASLAGHFPSSCWSGWHLSHWMVAMGFGIVTKMTMMVGSVERRMPLPLARVAWHPPGVRLGAMIEASPSAHTAGEEHLGEEGRFRGPSGGIHGPDQDIVVDVILSSDDDLRFLDLTDGQARSLVTGRWLALNENHGS